MWEWLKGKKTYLVAAVSAGVSFALAMDWIDLQTAGKISGFLITAFGITLRLAVADLKEKTLVNPSDPTKQVK